MVRLMRVLALVFVLFSSCALSKAIYLGRDMYSVKTGPQSVDAIKIGNINGLFPEAVYIKIRTQTFNTYHLLWDTDNRDNTST
jgi:hypothetical protein